LVLAKGGEAFSEIPMGNTLTYGLERDIILYERGDQLSIAWVIAALHGFRIRGYGAESN